MTPLVHGGTQASLPWRGGTRPLRTKKGFPLALVLILAVLVCLIPKPENDLFFELRTGTDILTTGHLPHADPYSWTRHGAPWDVPEWGAFVLYALAYRTGRFFGVWLLMTGLALTAAALIWTRLSRGVGPAEACALTALMLLAISPCLQERPYAFTYPLMAAALILLHRIRAGRPRVLLALVSLCAFWTNLHQGVLAFVGLALACAIGDALTAAHRRWRNAQTAPDLLTPDGLLEAQRRETDPDGPRAHAVRARRMLLTTIACAAGSLLSPYGWGVYRTVFVTLRDRPMMSNVTEWNPITVLPPSQLPPFVLVALVAFGALALSRRRNLADLFMLLGLLAESLLHARQTALFALAATVIATPHFPDALDDLRRRVPLPPASRLRTPLLAALALLCIVIAAAAGFNGLRRVAPPGPLTLEAIGEAVARVPTYPAAACDFLDHERLPADLRLLNNFETGGYLIWRHRPDFIDGRLDLYTGPFFLDALTLTRAPASPAGRALLQKYGINAILTTDRRQARQIATLPDWQCVYADTIGPHSPHARIFLRRHPSSVPTDGPRQFLAPRLPAKPPGYIRPIRGTESQNPVRPHSGGNSNG